MLQWGFSLTPVSWRKKDLAARLQKSADLQSGAAAFEHGDTGEEGVNQIRALLGLDAFVTWPASTTLHGSRRGPTLTLT